MRKKVLVIQAIADEAMARLEARADVEVEVLRDTSAAAIVAAIGDADAVTIRDAPLPEAAVDAARQLRIGSRHGVGYDNIPVELCTARGIAVTVIGPVNTVAVAEHAFFLMLAAAKRGAHLDRAVRAGDFAARSRYLTLELRGQTLSIIGFGRIGQELAARARAFGMTIAVYDPVADRAAHPDVVFHDTLDAALGVGDVVSLHVPLSPRTRGMIGREELARMPTGSILVNTARGGIVDEQALAEALEAGHLHAAGLDVFEQEPPLPDNPLLVRDDVVLSPHNAALSSNSLIGMGLHTVDNVLACFDDTLDPTLVVNAEVLG